MYSSRGEVISLRDLPGGGERYPMWQLSERGGLVPGLGGVIQTLRARGFTSRETYRFFTSSNSALQARPVDVLRAGDLYRVLFEASRATNECSVR